MMPLRRLAALARTTLIAMLCVAVTAFVLPTGQGKADAHGATVEDSHDHHGHSHDDGPSDHGGHDDRHAADHSHDTPTYPPLLTTGFAPRLAGNTPRAEHRVAAIDPAPRHRPPRSLA